MKKMGISGSEKVFIMPPLISVTDGFQTTVCSYLFLFRIFFLIQK